MTKFLLLRHAYTGVKERRQLPNDSLSREGFKQALLLADRLSKTVVGALYSSPYRRAVQTANYLAQRKDLPLRIDPRLSEIELWLSPEDLHDDSQAQYQQALAVLRQAQEKVRLFLAHFCKRHPNEVVAIVSHGNLIRSILGVTLKMSLESIVRLEVYHTSITELEWEDSYREPFYRLLRFNDTAHLEKH